MDSEFTYEEFAVKIYSHEGSICVSLKPIDEDYFIKGLFLGGYKSVKPPNWVQSTILKMSWGTKVLNTTRSLVRKARARLEKKPDVQTVEEAIIEASEGLKQEECVTEAQ